MKDMICLETTSFSNHMELLILQKFKHRKVPAIRTFPPGCGQNVTVLNITKKADAVSCKGNEGKVASSDVILGDVDTNNAAYSEGCEAKSTETFKDKTPITVKSLKDSDMEGMSSLIVPNKVIDDKIIENARDLVVDSPTACVVSTIEPMNVLPCNYNCDYSREVDNPDLVNSKSLEDMKNSLDGDISTNVASELPIMVQHEAITKKYTRRRNISAVRDFPPLCGDSNKLNRNPDISLKGDPMISENAAVQKNIEGEGSKTCDGRGQESQQEATLVLVKQEKAHKESSACFDEDHACHSFQLDSGFPSVDRENNSEDVAKSVRVMKKDVVPSGSVFKLDNLKSNSIASDVDSDLVVVLGLMAAPFCPWRGSVSAGLSIDKNVHKRGRKRKNKVENSASVGNGTHASMAVKDDLQAWGDKSLVIRSLPYQDASNQLENQYMRDGSSNVDGGSQDHHIVASQHTMHVNPLPLRIAGPNSYHYEHDEGNMRFKVRETLRLFQVVFRKLMHGEESRSKEGKGGLRRIDLKAAKILKSKGRYINTREKVVGAVPGVEVGDEFQYRVELAIIGVHHVLQGGIDYVNRGRPLATSIVASGGYSDDMDNSDVLIYSGSGGNVMGGDKAPEDQKLERGNLALKNSAQEKNPVRVIRGFKEKEFSDSKPKMVSTYTYDGLYVVEKFWQEPGQHGKLVFKFQLTRVPGQPELAWKEVRKSQKTVREGLCMNDISQGKELTPICVFNTIDNENPPPFTYTTKVIYPNNYQPAPPVGCDCIGGCSDSVSCSCAVKNGDEIPYNQNGAIVEAKSLVYECGPSCKCPPSCTNRVSQHGIRFQLEVFKTESRGWGVRSLNSIPSGSFICEYTGQILEEKEAERRAGNDEYLFDIGNQWIDHSLFKGLEGLVGDSQTESCESMENAGFTIDAALFGSVGRFINHGCSPNLYAQNVLYDHHDKRMPHIMLFAAENIPPLQELAYHYNYKIDEVRDSDGNIKKKSCHCGTSECTGRMY